MKKLSKLSKSAIIALSLVGISMAGVGTAAVAAGQAGNTTAPLSVIKQDHKVSDAVAIAQSKLTLAQAIAIAQKTVKGNVVSAEFDQEDHGATSEFEVKLVKGDTEYEIKIDASTGKVTKAEQERMDADDLADYKTMQQAKVNLNQAMQNATQKYPGKLLEAEFDMEKGQAVYKIKIAQGTQVQKVVIDANTGKIIATKTKS